MARVRRLVYEIEESGVISVWWVGRRQWEWLGIFQPKGRRPRISRIVIGGAR